MALIDGGTQAAITAGKARTAAAYSGYELVYQTWERITGRPWSDARKGGFTSGSYADNIALQKRLLGGWDPYAAAKPKPRAAPKAAPKPAPKPTPSVPMQLEPGAYLKLQEEILELQRQEQTARDANEKERLRIERERLEQIARETELRLSTSPIDYVAYELYKREREAAGETLYTGAPASDEDIQAMMAAMAGEGGGYLGTGEFGVEVPMTQAISRAESRSFSPAEMDILSSFLKAGFDVGGEQVSYDPVDYWREVEEGFVPTIQTPAATRYAF